MSHLPKQCIINPPVDWWNVDFLCAVDVNKDDGMTTSNNDTEYPFDWIGPISRILEPIWLQNKWFARKGAKQRARAGRGMDDRGHGVLFCFFPCEINCVRAGVGRVYSQVSPSFVARVKPRSSMMRIICSPVNTRSPKPAPWRSFVTPSCERSAGNKNRLESHDFLASV